MNSPLSVCVVPSPFLLSQKNQRAGRWLDPCPVRAAEKNEARMHTLIHDARSLYFSPPHFCSPTTALARPYNAVMKYLIQFSQQHESFWLPELDTLLELNGVDPVTAYDHDVAWAVVSRGHKVRRPLALLEAGNPVGEGKRIVDGRCCTLGCLVCGVSHFVGCVKRQLRNTYHATQRSRAELTVPPL